ncbi:MAG TPA: hypothetical protein VGB10_05665 [Bacteroidota bacterium]
MEPHVQPLTPFWTFAVKYGFVIIVLVFYVTAALHFDYTPDDTYIYMQYAKNIASGDGFAFNAGEPSYGVTGPLWALLIAAGAAMGLDPYIVGKTFDLVFASVAVAMVYVLTFFVVRDKRYAVLGAAMYSFDVWFLRWAGSGMESSLSVVLVLLSFMYVYRNEYHLAAIAAGVLTLVRPEGALLFAAIQVDNFLNSKEVKPAFRSFLVSCGLYALAVLPWVLFSALYFGTVIPNTFIAKTSAGFSWESMLASFTTIVKIIGSSQGICGLALMVGLAIFWKREGWWLIRLDFLGLLWIVLLPLAYIVLSVQVVSRYLLMVSPFIVIYGLWGLKRLEEEWKLPERTAMAALAVVAVLSVGLNQYVYYDKVVPHMEQFAAGMNDALKPIAYWLHESTDADAVVLTPDVGLIGYVSGRRMFDTAGLVTPAVKKAFGNITYNEGMRKQLYKSVVEPDYILDRGDEPERLASPDILPVMTGMFPSMSVTNPEKEYYTLYKVAR